MRPRNIKTIVRQLITYTQTHRNILLFGDKFGKLANPKAHPPVEPVRLFEIEQSDHSIYRQQAGLPLVGLALSKYIELRRPL